MTSSTTLKFQDPRLTATPELREGLLKELRHGLCILKNLASIFQVGQLQSVLIFSILNHPCSFWFIIRILVFLISILPN